MKKLMMAALALAMAAPAVASADSGDRGRHGRHHGGWERHHDRGGDWDRRGGWDRHDGRDRDWDGRRHHGDRTRVVVVPQYRYYAPAPTYYYSPPPSYGYYGGHRWSRGGYLPPQYRRQVVYDYYDYGWAPPPRGYAYYRTDTGDIILAAIATGLILSIIGGGW